MWQHGPLCITSHVKIIEMYDLQGGHFGSL